MLHRNYIYVMINPIRGHTGSSDLYDRQERQGRIMKSRQHHTNILEDHKVGKWLALTGKPVW